MRVIHVFCLLSLLISNYNFGQNMKDYVVSTTHIYGLEGNHSVSVYNRNTLEKEEVISTIQYGSLKGLALRNQALVLLTDSNEVFAYQDQVWKSIYKSKYTTNKLVYTHNGEGYLITDKGIEELATGRIYLGAKSLNGQIRIKKGMFSPSTVYVDKRNRLWLGFSFGEWGGGIQVFDTHTKQFATLSMNKVNLELLPVVNFFESEESVYFTSGLAHLMYTGNLVKFDQYTATEVLAVKSSSIFEDIPAAIDFLTAGDYSISEQAIYLFAGKNILKGSLTKDLSVLNSWEQLLPKHQNKENEVVLKLSILDKDKLIYLSSAGVLMSYTEGKVVQLN